MVETLSGLNIDDAIKQPFDLLSLLLQENVYVKLRHNRSMTGFLVAYDEHLNLMLNDAVETIQDENGTLERK